MSQDTGFVVCGNLYVGVWFLTFWKITVLSSSRVKVQVEYPEMENSVTFYSYSDKRLVDSWRGRLANQGRCGRGLGVLAVLYSEGPGHWLLTSRGSGGLDIRGLEQRQDWYRCGKKMQKVQWVQAGCTLWGSHLGTILFATQYRWSVEKRRSMHGLRCWMLVSELGAHCEVVTWELYCLRHSTDGVSKKGEACTDWEAECWSLSWVHTVR